MNGPVHGLSVPAEFTTLEEPSCLLPGESRREFDMIRQMIIEGRRRGNQRRLPTADITCLVAN